MMKFPRGRPNYINTIDRIKTELRVKEKEIEDLNKKIAVVKGEKEEAWEIIRELRRELLNNSPKFNPVLTSLSACCAIAFLFIIWSRLETDNPLSYLLFISSL